MKRQPDKTATIDPPRDLPPDGQRQQIHDDQFLVPSQVTVGTQTYDLGLKVDLARLMPLLANQGLAEVSPDPPVHEVLAKFLRSVDSPREGSRGTRDGFYGVYLPKALPVLGLRPTPFHIDSFIKSLADPDRKPKPCSPGGQKAYFGALRAFYNWLYSKRSPYENFKPEDNPFHRDNGLKPPDVPNRYLPRQTEESVLALMTEAGKGEHPVRDQALLAIYIESGARLREVAGINEPEVIWAKYQFRATIKGGDEKVYGFGLVGESLLRDWLIERPPNGGNIWGLKWAGIRQVLRRLEERTGIKCNAHTFRRGFACIQRERGVDSADIMTLGNWRSIQMVLRYTKSIDFDNAQRRYREPLRLQAENPRVPSSILGLGTSGIERQPLTFRFLLLDP